AMEKSTCTPSLDRSILLGHPRGFSRGALSARPRSRRIIPSRSEGRRRSPSEHVRFGKALGISKALVFQPEDVDVPLVPLGEFVVVESPPTAPQLSRQACLLNSATLPSRRPRSSPSSSATGGNTAEGADHVFGGREEGREDDLAGAPAQHVTVR